MTDLSTLQAQLKQVQTDVKKIDTSREKLAREAFHEEQKTKESLARLKELGVKEADTMTVADLEALRGKTQAALEANLNQVQASIAAANAVLAEYEATVRE